MAETKQRPLVTFVLLAYNQEHYVEEAVAGALAQDYSPLEIILSDDCSHDRTFEIMQRMAANYKGPHKIVLNRNERNLGIGGHVQLLSSLSSGEIVIGAAGDDLSRPDRTSRSVEAFLKDPRVLVFVAGFDCFDTDSQPIEGRWQPRPYEYTLKNFAKGLINVHGATAAWHRSLFTNWPSLETVIHEDRVLPFRALLLGGTIATTNDCLVTYRSSGGISRLELAGYSGLPPEYRQKVLHRIRPDAAARLNDLHHAGKAEGNIAGIAKNYLASIDAELKAVTGSRLLLDIRYLLLSIREMNINHVKTYLKMRFRKIFGILRTNSKN